MNAITATALGKRYGNRWALRDCCFAIPSGRICALVGPNGAGKTTFLHLAMGFLAPTTGSIGVLEEQPRNNNHLLSRIGFVAQDVPLYKSFTVAETLRFGAALNPGWDEVFAKNRLLQLGIPFDQRVGSLSGGQRAQVSLAVALGKRPEVLLLDEPLASLDPLARRDFLQTLLESAVDTGMTVVLSSHLISDLERVCNHLIVLSSSRAQVAGDIDELLESHRVLTGPRREANVPAGIGSVVSESHSERQTTFLVRSKTPIADPRWIQEDVGLEELVIAYLESPAVTALPIPKVSEDT